LTLASLTCSSRKTTFAPFEPTHPIPKIAFSPHFSPFTAYRFDSQYPYAVPRGCRLYLQPAKIEVQAVIAARVKTASFFSVAAAHLFARFFTLTETSST